MSTKEPTYLNPTLSKDGVHRASLSIRHRVDYEDLVNATIKHLEHNMPEVFDAELAKASKGSVSTWVRDALEDYGQCGLDYAAEYSSDHEQEAVKHKVAELFPEMVPPMFASYLPGGES